MDEGNLKLHVGLQGEDVVVVLRQGDPNPLTSNKNIQMTLEMYRKLVFYQFTVEHISEALLDSMKNPLAYQ